MFPPSESSAAVRSGRKAAVRRAVCGGLLAMVIVYAGFGCSTPEERYRVLSFFFDGVPVPESMLKDMPELAGDAAKRKAEEAAEKQAATYYHRPYIDRRCDGCHQRDHGFKPSTDPTETCKTCHPSYFQYEPSDWVHGPVALKECAMCHQPHKSEHPGLLTAEQTDVCLNCHQPELLSEDYHLTAREGQDRCGRCHDPHLAGNRMLLVDSRTYANRRVGAFEPVSRHKPFVDKQCGSCHVVEEQNRVKDDIDATCRSCHQQIIDAAALPGSGVHQAVADGKCIHCHNPHQSPRRNLLRVTAERMCISCHAIEDLEKANHPGSMVRVDCLICHKGHHSERPHLLRTFELDPPEDADEPAPAPVVPLPEKQPTEGLLQALAAPEGQP